MRVLGIDPASIKAGYAVIDVASGGRLTFVDAGVLSAPAGWRQDKRLVTIAFDLEGVIDEHHPDVAACESGFVKHLRGALTLGESRGVLKYVCGRAGLVVTEYAPSTAKKAATGDGHADKKAVARLVAMRLGLRVVPDADAADAIAVAICRSADTAAGWVERPRAAAG